MCVTNKSTYQQSYLPIKVFTSKRKLKLVKYLNKIEHTILRGGGPKMWVDPASQYVKSHVINIRSRGTSLVRKEYEISIETIGFQRISKGFLTKQ